jgi:uncharacterized protein YkwD
MVALPSRLSVPTFAAVIATSFALATPTAHAANCPGADVSAAVASVDTVRGATLCLLNAERAAHGLTPLTSQPLLDGAATSYSRAMVDQHFFAHVSPAGENLEQRLSAYSAPAQSWSIGENLAWGEGSRATPSHTVDSWMHSEGHRANVLNPSFREAGVGVVPGTPVGSAPEDSATFTVDFGTRVTSAAGSIPAPRAGVGPRMSATIATAGASDPMQHGSSRAKPAKKVSAAKKRTIKARCATIARRARGSRAARKARAASCVRSRLRAAARG